MSSQFHHFLLLFLINFFRICSPLRTLNIKDDPLPIDTVFELPSPSPKWPNNGGGFASGSIDLGGLQLHQITSFNKTWRIYEGGPNNLGATFFEPSSIPNGFFMLGSYGQPNNKPLFGEILVGKDLINGALSQPIDYTLVWSSESSQVHRDGNGYIWLPIPPNGYKSVGYIVTTSHEKPPLDKTRCVRIDFTGTCENDSWIWGNDGIDFFGFGQSNVQARGISLGTFLSKSSEGNSVVSCLRNSKNGVSNSMPDLNQVNDLIKAYSPWVYFHPDDEFRPSSVSWYLKNGVLLYKKGDENNPITIDPLGSILPQNGSNDGSYWLDLPKDEGPKEQVKKGDLQDAGAYLHIKPMFDGTYTDIAVWLFYPFNGNAKAKYGIINIPLGKIGEHVGDWEHVTLRISNLDGKLKSVYFSQHSGGIWVNAPNLEYQDGNKPVTYSSLHSHAFQPHTGTVLLGGTEAIGICMEAAKGDEVIDTGTRYVTISAEYLGVIEPPWLNFAREWGPKNENELGREIEKIRELLPGPLRDEFDKLIKKVPAELLGQEGPTGPKWKNSWLGDEST